MGILTPHHLGRAVCAEPGSVLVDGFSGRVFVAPDARTAIAQSCKVLADRDTAVKALTENAFDV